jgi:hypothetical protein
MGLDAILLGREGRQLTKSEFSSKGRLQHRIYIEARAVQRDGSSLVEVGRCGCGRRASAATKSKLDDRVGNKARVIRRSASSRLVGGTACILDTIVATEVDAEL